MFLGKNFFFIILLIIINFSNGFSQKNIWTVGTAKTLPARQFDIPFFQPCRYGITESLEVSSHPVWFFIMPNFSLKKEWFMWKEIIFSTKHGFHYPSLALDIFKDTDNNGIIEDTTKVPNIYAFKNEFYASRFLLPPTRCTAANYLLTLKIGHQFAIEKGISLSVDIEYISITEYYLIEHKFLVLLHRKNDFSIVFGYKLTFAELPYRKDIFLMPLCDFMWKFNIKKKREKGLFKEKRF
ncbi:MAG: hypothetical protein B6I24_07290 [Bacteroidetes bacterium 4572_128]|nr:MAG: hypothetical protein B6I24_07290 [Bacteroidetes bacterium 4572_128]